MNLKILEEKENNLFGRKEVLAVLNSEITPDRNHVLELLSKHFSVSPEHIKIKGINGNFGAKDFTIEANIYHSVDEKNIVEIKKKKEASVVRETPAQ